ncbi:MAG: DNA polymerase IV [Tissierellales bacterium]|nr:DNA polymerase IV [Tissierellales bacterium]
MNDRIVFHIDVNSAYLSWEAAHNLQMGSNIDLRNVPSIVGGDQEKRHGIVLAKSIPAKKYGIKTGESVYSALEKCPELIVISPHYDIYMKASKAMVDFLYDYSPLIQRYSIDEVFLDYTNGNLPYMEAAMKIKEGIKKELGFTVNIGIGPNKLLAKMASDFTKPDKIHTLFYDEIEKKMWPLPVEDLFMIGYRTKKKLNSRGIFTIGELAHLDRDYIYSWLKKPGLLIWEYANGIENSDVKISKSKVKSIGNSTTLPFDVSTKEEAMKVLLGISEMVGMRLRELNIKAEVISVSLKTSEFFSYSHQKKLNIPTSSTNTIYKTALALFEEMWDNSSLRCFSISLSSLVYDDFIQLSFFENFNEKELILDKSIDNIRKKFGQSSVIRSAFLYSGIDPIIGGVVAEENYPMMSSYL